MNYNYFNPKKTVLLLMSVILILLSECIMAQEENRYVPETDPLVNQKLKQWQDIKFGLLMHWGTYSQWGIVE